MRLRAAPHRSATGHRGTGPALTDCVFCRIVAGDLPSDQVYADDDAVAFRDLDPQAPSHVLVVPRRHVADLAELARSAPELAAPVLRAVDETAQALGLDEYRVVANRGAGAGQAVFHLHLHVIGGRALRWPPG